MIGSGVSLAFFFDDSDRGDVEVTDHFRHQPFRPRYASQPDGLFLKFRRVSGLVLPAFSTPFAGPHRSAALLTLYGALLALGGVLVVAGVIPASETADWTALR